MSNFQLLTNEGDVIEESLHDIVYDEIQHCWVSTGWVVTDINKEFTAKPSIEFKSALVRADRNLELTKTDWTQGKDIPTSISDVWAIYRQQLRDIPTQEGFPYEVVWPTKPE